MWDTTSSTLLLIALGTIVPALSATDTVERDRAAAAIITFIDQGMGLPAQRWMQAWMQARYPDEGRWLEKVLRCRHARQFATTAGASAGDLSTDQFQRLQDEVRQADLDGRLPPAAHALMGNPDADLKRLQERILPILNPNLPLPAVEPVPERKALLDRLLRSLAEQAADASRGAMAKAQAHIAGPEAQELPRLQENDPRAIAIANQSVNLRIAVLQPLLTAHTLLRDAAQRGRDFGIEGQVHREWLHHTARDLVDTLSQWQYAWGAANPYLNHCCLVWMAEAYRQGVREVKDGRVVAPLSYDDIESRMKELIATDASRIPDAGERQELQMVRVRACDALLRWDMELGDARYLQLAAATWREFQELARRESSLQLDQAPAGIRNDLGFLHLTAGRLLRARRDEAAAQGEFAQVAGARTMHPGIREYARGWMTREEGAGSTGSWAASPAPMDPGAAQLVAAQLIQGADETADAALAGRNLLRAAVVLRNAAYGLETPACADQFRDKAPRIFGLYVAVLVRMGLRQHAAIAGVQALERLQAFIDREAAGRRPHPWQGGDGREWAVVQKLARETYRIAQGVYACNQAFGPTAEASRTLLARLGGAGGPTLDLDDVDWLLGERRYGEAVAKCEDFARRYPVDKYPDEELQVFTRLISARLGLLEAGDVRHARSDQVALDVKRDNQAMEVRILRELGRTDLEGQRRRALERVRGAISSSAVWVLMQEKRYDQVIALLDPAFWRQAPGDDALAAGLLTRLCHACAGQYGGLTQASPPEVVLADGERFLGIYRIHARQARRLAGRHVDAELRRGARVLHQVLLGTALIARQVGERNGNDARLAALANAAALAHADLFEPLIDGFTKAEDLWRTAQLLWDGDAHGRAAGIYARYQGLLDRDEELQSFRRDPKRVLDGYTSRIAVRQEYRAPWSAIVDLSWDPPESLEAMKAGVADPGNMPVSYDGALLRLEALHQRVVKDRDVMDAKAFAGVEGALAACERLLWQAHHQRRTMMNLAQAHREAGEQEKALALLLPLYEQEPLNPAFATGVVEATLMAYRDNRIDVRIEVGRKQLARAQQMVARIRSDLERDAQDRAGYWTAYIQGLELTAALGDIRSVDDTLRFLRINKSDISRDLIMARVEVVGAGGGILADAAQVRRPRHAMAVQLAERFLACFAIPGITEQPPFRIVRTLGPEMPALFTDPDAPAMKLVMVQDQDLREVGVVMPAGTAVDAAPSRPVDHQAR